MSTPTIDALTAIVRNPKAPDLTVRQIVVLARVISQSDADRTIRAMAEHFSVPKPSITRAVDRLQNGGFVTRVVDETDRRSIFIRPTPAGRKFLEWHFGKVETV